MKLKKLFLIALILIGIEQSLELVNIYKKNELILVFQGILLIASSRLIFTVSTGLLLRNEKIYVTLLTLFGFFTSFIFSGFSIIAIMFDFPKNGYFSYFNMHLLISLNLISQILSILAIVFKSKFIESK